MPNNQDKEAPLSYNKYLRVPDLIGLQECLSDPVHHDELLFITIHQAYELWFIPKGHSPMPGRIFTVDSTGHAMLPEQMPAEALQNVVIAITLEPKSGSAVPTLPIYLSTPGS